MRKILVRGVNWIGDSLFMTPALNALRKGFPDSEITLLITPWVKEIFDGNPDVDEIIIYDKRGKEKTLWGKIKFILSLRKKKFNLAIVMQPVSYEAALLVYFARVPERVGYSHGLRNLFLTRVVEFPRGPVHDIDIFLGIPRSLGFVAGEKRPYFPFSQEAEDWARRFLLDHAVDEKDLLIGINPGAFKEAKRWPEERYAKLADIIIAQLRAKVIIFQGPGDDKTVSSITGLMREKPIVAKTTLKQLAELSKKCRVFISNDTGPAHIASVSGTKVIVLFGPADPVRSRPWGNNCIVIKKDIPCSPCRRVTCRKLTCMKAITLEEVLAEVQRQLEGVQRE